MTAAPPKVIHVNGVNRINPAYLQWKKNGGKVESTPSRTKLPVSKVDFSFDIIKARDLVAKDRNMFGKKTTSDPYVEVWLCSDRKHEALCLGKTPTVKKNLNPQWNHQLRISVPFLNAPWCNQLQFRIFDEDLLSAPDAMGTITLPFAWTDGNQQHWHEVPKTSAKNAQGSIELRVQSKVHHARPYV